MQTFIELVSNVFSYAWSQMFDKPCTSLTLLLHLHPCKCEKIAMGVFLILLVGLKSYLSFQDDKYFIISSKKNFRELHMAVDLG
jgi:hypothetical protein